MKVDYAKIIKERLKLADVIGKDITLIKSGENYKALCPFHNEKTPSFVVNTARDTFKCFGCGISGDAFTYVMERYKLDFKEAIKLLAVEANVKIEFNNLEGQTNYKSSKKYFEITNLIENFYYKNLINFLKSNRIQFLESKKIGYNDIEQFKIGLSSSSQHLENYLLEKGISLELLVDLGIFKINNYGKAYDLFNNRIMFPIKDNFGRTTGFGGRKLTGDGPKYVNSWENDFFKKRNLLYNMSGANKIKNKSQALYIVEGYTDVIALNKLGLIAVAPLGTSISIEQISFTWNYVSEPILFLDGDNAGIKASSRVIDLALPELAPGKSLNFIFIGTKEDPDDILNSPEGEMRIKEILSNKLTFFDSLIFLEEIHDLNSPENILDYKNRINNKIDLIKDTETKNLYKLFAKNNFKELIGEQINNRYAYSNNNKKDKYFIQTTKSREPEYFVLRRERSILLVMINNFKLLVNFDEVLAKTYIGNTELSNLRDVIIEIISQNKVKNAEELKALLIKRGYSNIIKKHFSTKDCINFNLLENYAKESSNLEHSKKVFMDIINIQETWYRNKNKSLSKNL